jgi:hypothetical protein
MSKHHNHHAVEEEEEEDVDEVVVVTADMRIESHDNTDIDRVDVELTQMKVHEGSQRLEQKMKTIGKLRLLMHCLNVSHARETDRHRM